MSNIHHAHQFSSLAQFYEDMMAWPVRKLVEIPSVQDFLGDISGLRILDFGCGSGFYARLLKTMGAGHVTGYDASEGMLSFARHKEHITPCNIQYISQLSGHESKYDIVLAVYVMPYAETVEQLQTMLTAMVSLLRPGGRLVAVPVSPFFNNDKNYYLKYGFTLSSEGKLENGKPLTLSFPGNRSTVAVTAWYWSQKVINDVLIQSGLEKIRWAFPRASSISDDDFLDDYIEIPHALLVEAIRK